MIGFKRRPAVYGSRISASWGVGARGQWSAINVCFVYQILVVEGKEGIAKKSRPADYPTGVT